MDGIESKTTAGSLPGDLNSPANQAAPSRLPRKVSLALGVGVVAWFLAVIVAMIRIINYSNSPGSAGLIPSHWPAQSQIPLHATLPTLVLFAHPHCPCTRATIGELELLMARSQGKVSAQVMFIRPAGTAEDWTKTDLWQKAAAIPGVLVHRDDDGRESRLFNSETSGQTMLYDHDGKLLFEGGITISRGHSGDNPGRSALTALLDHQLATEVKTPVFGCSLFDSECQQGTDVCKP